MAGLAAPRLEEAMPRLELSLHVRGINNSPAAPANGYDPLVGTIAHAEEPM